MFFEIHSNRRLEESANGMGNKPLLAIALLSEACLAHLLAHKHPDFVLLHP